MFDATTVNV
jgi:hypothetical protein